MDYCKYGIFCNSCDISLMNSGHSQVNLIYLFVLDEFLTIHFGIMFLAHNVYLPLTILMRNQAADFPHMFNP